MFYHEYKYINDKCNKYYKKKLIIYFYHSYTFLNKKKTLEILTIYSFDSNNLIFVTQIIANKKFEINIIQKIIANFNITQNFIVTKNFICN